MSQFVKDLTLSRDSASAIGPFLRATITGGQFALAGNDVKAIGVIVTGRYSHTGDVQQALLRSAPRLVMVASEAVDAGEEVYAAADGKVATTGSVLEGIALTDAAGNNSTFEVVPA